MTILITGVAGFIGMHVAERFFANGEKIVGVDSLNNYYDINLKEDRLKRLCSNDLFTFEKFDLADYNKLKHTIKENHVKIIIHLAAQAGVRYSITNPHSYASSNLVGFLNILEVSRENNVDHLVYASSSSVYGGNTRIPFTENDAVDHPVSLYAATKKSNELMAHAYSHLYQIPTTGLRFFTVYGPWGRPDMSPMLFTRAIFEGRPINVFNFGDMKRDFTYIDDIVEGIIRVARKPSTPNLSYNSDLPDPATSNAPWRVFNIGNHEPVDIMTYIDVLENIIGKKAVRNYMPMQLGDVKETYAETNLLREWVDFSPQTDLVIGLKKFIDWVKYYYNYN